MLISVKNRSHVLTAKYVKVVIFYLCSLTLFPGFVIAQCPAGSIIYVRTGAPAGGNGQSWTTAYNNLQTAINAAAGCSVSKQIWVAKGTYYPSEKPWAGLSSSDRDRSFYLRSNLSVYGGFDGTETVLSERNISLNPTILSGDIGVPGNNADNCYHVIVSVMPNQVSQFNGFTITGGNANANSDFTFSIGSTPYLLSRAHGAGICNFSGSGLSLINLAIVQNRALSFGGGLYNFKSSPVITNTIFFADTANYGGGINSEGSAPQIINCVFSQNYGVSNGGAIRNYDARPQIVNSIIWDNRGSGIKSIYSSNNSDTTKVSYSIVDGPTIYGGTNNGNSNPLFVNLADAAGPDGNWLTADDGLQLSCGSPAINSGRTLSGDATTDVLQVARRGGYDMGAYEQLLAATGILYVDSSNAKAANGSNWERAYASLYEAMDVARSNSCVKEIWVAKGTYQPPGSNSFAMVPHVKILGGFLSGATLLSQRNPKLHQTICTATASLIGTFKNENIDTTAQLDGFTITNQNYATMGGGMCNYTAASPKIINCVFSDLRGNLGGAVCNTGGSAPYFVNCVFAKNSGNAGGAMANQGSSPVLINCIFFRNTATRGPVMDNYASSVQMYNCSAVHQTYGSAIYNEQSIYSGKNNIYFKFQASPFSQIFTNVQSVITLENNFSQEVLAGNGNIVGNPTLTNVGNPAGNDGIFGTADDGLRPDICSPLLNAGQNLIDILPANDFAGDSRTQMGFVDIGAYESGYDTPAQPTVTISAANPLSVCQPMQNTFSAAITNSIPGMTYRWFVNNTLAGTSPSLNYTPANLDTILLRVTGCGEGLSNKLASTVIVNNRIFVDSSIQVPGNGTSWSNAFKSLGEALDSARNTGCIREIWVAKGSYQPPAGQSFRMVKSVKIIGGFKNTDISLNQRDFKVNKTICKANGNRVFINDYTGFEQDARMDTTAVLDGFTITGGTTPVTSAGVGGGGMLNNYASPKIQNCIFIRNGTDQNGGAVCNINLSSPYFSGCVFEENNSRDGGAAINYYESNPWFTNCFFIKNTAAGSGGALYSHQGSVWLTNCVFAQNGAGVSSCLYTAQRSVITINNCSFVNNSATGNMGTLTVSGSSLSITNSIIWNNRRSSNPEMAIHNLYFLSQVVIQNCILENGVIPAGSTNNAPIFSDPGSPAGLDGIPGTADDGFRLLPCSPGVNAGLFDPAASSNTITDIAGNPRRFQNTNIDMGAYELQSVPTDTAALVSENANTTIYSSKSAITPVIAGCRSLALVESTGLNPVNGLVSARVWVDNIQPLYNGQTYVRRHYEFVPAGDAATATGRLTIFATQQEFDDFTGYGYNTHLPSGPNDAVRIAQLRIFKYAGQSSDGTGSPGSYPQPGIEINPDDNDIVWNNAQQRWEISFNVTGFSGFFIGNAGLSILPVKLISFSGGIAGIVNAELEWQTAYETDAAHFELQRSEDGRNFSAIARVSAKGNAQNLSAYLWLDKNLRAGLYHYRLMIFDKNGSREFSQVVSIKIKGNATFTLYPQPASNYVRLAGDASGMTGKNIILSDMSGKTIKTIRIKNWPFDLHVADLPQGVFLLSMPEGQILKIIKN